MNEEGVTQLASAKHDWSGMQGLEHCRDMNKYRQMDKKHKLDVMFFRLDLKYNKFKICCVLYVYTSGFESKQGAFSELPTQKQVSSYAFSGIKVCSPP